MSVRIKHTITISLLLFVFVMPYATIVDAQNITITPIITPVPPEITVIPDLVSKFVPGAWATKTPRIDGAISSGFDAQGVEVPGEWDDAWKVDFLLPTSREESHSASFYIKNDAINLYIALVIRNEEFSINDMLHINFDNTNNKQRDSGDDQLWLDGATNQFRDLHYRSDGTSAWDPQQNGVGAAQFYHPLSLTTPIYTLFPTTLVSEDNPTSVVNPMPIVGGQAEETIVSPETLIPKTLISSETQTPAPRLAQTAPITSIAPVLPISTEIPPLIAPVTTRTIIQPPLISKGTWVFEMAHPLDSSDDARDINADLGSELGLSLAYWDGDGGVGGFPSFFDWLDMFEYRIASGPTVTVVPTADLSIGSIEITQAIQDESNSLPLARRKSTAVRVYLEKSGFAGSIPSVVYLYGKDADSGTTLPGPLVATVNAPTSPSRGMIWHSANFLLPASWVDLDHLALNIFVTSGTPETNYRNNWLVPTAQFTFHKMKVLNVYEVPINTGTADSPQLVSDAIITSNEEAMLKSYPVDEINFVRLDWTVTGKTYSGTLSSNKEEIKAKLNDIAGQLTLAWLTVLLLTGETPNFPLPNLIYGYYTSGGGSSNPTWLGGMGISAVGYIGTSRELTMAHEFNHDLDRGALNAGTWGRHAGPTFGPANCGAKGPDPAWPYSTDDIQTYGLDTSVWPFQVFPTSYPDFMSYCQGNLDDTKWVSPYRWENLFETLERSSLYPTTASAEYAKSLGALEYLKVSDRPLQTANTVTNNLGLMLQIHGELEAQDKLGNFEIQDLMSRFQITQFESPDPEAIMKLTGLPEVDDEVLIGLLLPAVQKVRFANTPGSKTLEQTPIGNDDVDDEGLRLNYNIVGYSVTGEELFSYEFFGSFVDAEGVESNKFYYSHNIPMTDGLGPGARIEIQVKGETLAVQEISSSKPEIQLLTPQGGEQLKANDLLEIKWEAKDPDDDELRFTVQYSNDGGLFWLPLASDLKEAELVINTSNIPGSTEKGSFVRVLASDGFNTVEARNLRPFFIQGKAPTVKIVSPASGSTYGYQDVISLKGRGFDPEDGPLPDQAFTWILGEDTVLGVGKTSDVVRLGPGTHLISLIGSDSEGNMGRDIIRVEIGLEDVPPLLQEEPLVRAGGGLHIYPAIDLLNVIPGDNVVLRVIIENRDVEAAKDVRVTINLPSGLKLAEEPTVNSIIMDPITNIGTPSTSTEVIAETQDLPIGTVWDFLDQGTVEVKFDEIDVHHKGIIDVMFKVDAGVKPEFDPTQLTIGLEAKASNVRPAVASVNLLLKAPEPPVEKTTTIDLGTITTLVATPPSPGEAAPIPGFEVYSVLFAIPILVWLRRRRRRNK